MLLSQSTAPLGKKHELKFSPAPLYLCNPAVPHVNPVHVLLYYAIDITVSLPLVADFLYIYISHIVDSLFVSDHHPCDVKCGQRLVCKKTGCVVSERDYTVGVAEPVNGTAEEGAAAVLEVGRYARCIYKII